MPGEEEPIKNTGTKEPSAENEIKVTSKGQIMNYVQYANRILTKTDHKTIIVKAMGKAIIKAVILVEVLKRRNQLHQINEISTMDFEEEVVPKDESEDKTK
jgi:DNA-binding protein